MAFPSLSGFTTPDGRPLEQALMAANNAAPALARALDALPFRELVSAGELAKRTGLHGETVARHIRGRLVADGYAAKIDNRYYVLGSRETIAQLRRELAGTGG